MPFSLAHELYLATVAVQRVDRAKPLYIPAPGDLLACRNSAHSHKIDQHMHAKPRAILDTLGEATSSSSLSSLSPSPSDSDTVTIFIDTMGKATGITKQRPNPEGDQANEQDGLATNPSSPVINEIIKDGPIASPASISSSPFVVHAPDLPNMSVTLDTHNVPKPADLSSVPAVDAKSAAALPEHDINHERDWLVLRKDHILWRLSEWEQEYIDLVALERRLKIEYGDKIDYRGRHNDGGHDYSGAAKYSDDNDDADVDGAEPDSAYAHNDHGSDHYNRADEDDSRLARKDTIVNDEIIDKDSLADDGAGSDEYPMANDSSADAGNIPILQGSIYECRFEVIIDARRDELVYKIAYARRMYERVDYDLRLLEYEHREQSHYDAATAESGADADEGKVIPVRRLRRTTTRSVGAQDLLSETSPSDHRDFAYPGRGRLHPDDVVVSEQISDSPLDFSDDGNWQDEQCYEQTARPDLCQDQDHAEDLEINVASKSYGDENHPAYKHDCRDYIEDDCNFDEECRGNHQNLDDNEGEEHDQYEEEYDDEGFVLQNLDTRLLRASDYFTFKHPICTFRFLTDYFAMLEVEAEKRGTEKYSLEGSNGVSDGTSSEASNDETSETNVDATSDVDIETSEYVITSAADAADRLERRTEPYTFIALVECRFDQVLLEAEADVERSAEGLGDIMRGSRGRFSFSSPYDDVIDDRVDGDPCSSDGVGARAHYQLHSQGVHDGTVSPMSW